MSSLRSWRGKSFSFTFFPLVGWVTTTHHITTPSKLHLVYGTYISIDIKSRFTLLVLHVLHCISPIKEVQVKIFLCISGCLHHILVIECVRVSLWLVSSGGFFTNQEACYSPLNGIRGGDMADDVSSLLQSLHYTLCSNQVRCRGMQSQ